MSHRPHRVSRVTTLTTVIFAAVVVVAGLGLGPVPQRQPEPSTLDSAGAQASAPVALAPASPLPGQLLVPTAPRFAFDASKSIAWPARSVLFEADRLRIDVRGRTFKGGDPEVIRSWASMDERDFDIEWYENGVLMRLKVEMESDGSQYWIEDFMVYDGSRGDPRWISWEGPLYPTPLDRAMEADVRLSGGDGPVSADVAIDGMRVTAFHLGSGPAPLTDCEAPMPLDDDVRFALYMAQQPTRENDAQILEQARSRVAAAPKGRKQQARRGLKSWQGRMEAYWDTLETGADDAGLTVDEYLRARFEQLPLSGADVLATDFDTLAPPRSRARYGGDPGEPLLDDWAEPAHQFAGTDIWTMAPDEVERVLRGAGVCFDFLYDYPTSIKRSDHGGSGATLARERWCVAPPAGQVMSLEYRPDILRVVIEDGAVHAASDVPPQGWGCPTN